SLRADAGNAIMQVLPPLEQTVQFSVPERGGKDYAWQQVPTFCFSGPADRVFVVDRQRSLITFGDGLTGKLPVFDPERREMQVAYEVGAGEAGNVGNALRWAEVELRTTNPFSASNVVPAEGGKEEESLAEAQLRCRTLLNQRNRAVSKDDCE